MFNERERACDCDNIYIYILRLHVLGGGGSLGNKGIRYTFKFSYATLLCAVCSVKMEHVLKVTVINWFPGQVTVYCM